MEKYIELLNKYNQSHLLNFFKLMNEEQQKNFIKEIEDIDFEKIQDLYNSSINIEKKNKKLASLKYTDKYKISKEQFDHLESLGKEIIKNNKYAVVTMAGGQGTRLEHDGPKGTFLVNVRPEPKYLFQIIAENLISVNKEYGICLNWYIMTSTENNEKTTSFFEEHNYFNYDKNHIFFFEQGNLPLLSEDGKLFVDENYHIKYAADGNGCIFKAMKQNKVLDDMKSKGIEWAFIGSVDNILLNMCDPILLGLTISENNEIASKSVVKNNPHEKVGVFGMIDNHPSVIEYSELSEGMAEEVDEHSELVYGEAHIMCNLFSLKALEIIAQNNLPYHSAHKKVKHINENGEFVSPSEPNGFKYEAFIFDGFNYFDRISILRGKREEDFAPIKNNTGVDSPETAIKLYNDYWKL